VSSLAYDSTIPWRIHLDTWWEAVLHPRQAGRLVLRTDRYPGFTRFLTVVVAALYLFYGFGMGLFHGPGAALFSGLKLPLLFLFTVAVCLPPFYALNCLLGTRLQLRQCIRLHLMAISVNAVALASWALIGWFFALTGTGYRFLVLMHVFVFAMAGLLSVFIIWLIVRETAERLGRPLPGMLIAAWAVLFGVVGLQAAWALRPWIGTPGVPYHALRPFDGSFVEALHHLFL
jgi:hypothetical protein